MNKISPSHVKLQNDVDIKSFLFIHNNDMLLSIADIIGAIKIRIQNGILNVEFNRLQHCGYFPKLECDNLFCCLQRLINKLTIDDFIDLVNKYPFFGEIKHYNNTYTRKDMFEDMQKDGLIKFKEFDHKHEGNELQVVKIKDKCIENYNPFSNPYKYDNILFDLYDKHYSKDVSVRELLKPIATKFAYS
jgi:hypothetical protein